MKNGVLFSALRKIAEEQATQATGNIEDVNRDYDKTKSDNKKYLGHLFSNTNPYVTNTKKEFKKLLPGKEEKDGGGVLVKVAKAAYKFAQKNTPHIEAMPPSIKEAMFRGFTDELEKIGGIPGKIAGVPGQTLGQLKTKNSIGQQYGKVWDISGGASSATPAARPALSPGVAAMRQAKATNPGVLGRIAGMFGR